MVIDSFHKSFVMNMQLRQCFSRDKPFRLQKSLILPVFFFISTKSQRCSKKTRISKSGFKDKKSKMATLVRRANSDYFESGVKRSF